MGLAQWQQPQLCSNETIRNKMPSKWRSAWPPTMVQHTPAHLVSWANMSRLTAKPQHMLMMAQQGHLPNLQSNSSQIKAFHRKMIFKPRHQKKKLLTLSPSRNLSKLIGFGSFFACSRPLLPKIKLKKDCNENCASAPWHN